MRCFVVIVALFALPVVAQPRPVVFVHGISSSDLTWTSVATDLRPDYGEPMSVHADLNASADTDAASDVVLSGLVPLVRFSGEGRVVRRSGAPAATASRQFYVNFQAWADDDSLTVHADRQLEGRSESNESGIVKQGYALGLVIADVLAATGADQVVLVGHSMGGLAIREYLQRRDADGTPAWWVAEGEGGHRVAAAITYGTPHQGSNLNDLGTGVGGSAVADPKSEATRDLRYSYPNSALGQGRYLYGGAEVETDEFYSFDVTADGDLDDTVVGLNQGDPAQEYAVDNPALPLPRDVSYTWIVGDVRGLGGDGVVDADRQLLRRQGADGVEVLAPEGVTRRVVVNRSHVRQTSDVATIRDVLAGLATPAEGGAGRGPRLARVPQPGPGRRDGPGDPAGSVARPRGGGGRDGPPGRRPGRRPSPGRPAPPRLARRPAGAGRLRRRAPRRRRAPVAARDGGPLARFRSGAGRPIPVRSHPQRPCPTCPSSSSAS